MLGQLPDVDPEFDDDEPVMPGHGPVWAGGVDGAELELEPVLEFDEDAPELLVDVLGVVELDEDEPEFVVDVLGVVELDVAANAAVVPAPARTPEINSPATSCLVRSFIGSPPSGLVPLRDCGHLAETTRGATVKATRGR